MSSLLLANARIIDPSRGIDQTGDVLILDGKVADAGPGVASNAPKTVSRLDVGGRIVCPGLIDLHVHLREPGQSAKETIGTGACAAARGGFTTIVCMPNTSPSVDSPGTVRWIQDRARDESPVNVLVAGALTKDIAGEDLAPIGAMHKAGVVALTDDGRCIQNNELMCRVLEYSSMFGLPVMDHCQDYSMVSEGVMHDGRYSAVLGLRGWPAEGEELIVARNILLAERTGARVHCQHMSSAGSVRLLREAQARGVAITGEACPHHFTLTDAAVAGSEVFWREDGTAVYPELRPSSLPQWPAFDTNFKMNPPLRSARDREAVLQGVVDGVLSVIASDHAPHTGYEKQVEFDYAPFGITGLETELALSLMQLHRRRGMKLIDLLARFTTGPAGLLGLAGKGTLTGGADGDVTVIDPELAWQFCREGTASRSFNSPFYGWPLEGRAVATIVAGDVVWRDGTLGDIIPGVA
ncbi:MAG: dihydroorotase [Verrucomicrobiales bacterium]|nr:dihydroorotase [Verrucomicrobiales bacterium]